MNKRYVIKSIKKIKSFLILLFFIKGTLNSIFPASFLFNLLIILPLLSIIALIPLFVDLNKKLLFSIQKVQDSYDHIDSSEDFNWNLVPRLGQNFE